MPPPARRPRPVAGLPALDAAVVAKGWLLELVAARALADAAELPVGALAAEGPALCDGLLAALADDAALDALAGDGRAGRLAGAGDAASLLVAVEALRAATWRALRAALGADADPALAADAADRLAHAAHVLAVAAAPAARAAAAPAVVSPEEPSPDAPPAGPSLVVHEAPPVAAPEPWVAAIARRIARHAEDRAAFAVLAAEVADAERWLAADPAGAALEAAEAAVQAALRPGDQLVHERPGRFWIVAPATEADDARDLAATLAETAGRRALVGLAVGVANWPQDAGDAEALAARADERLLGALASGLPVA